MPTTPIGGRRRPRPRASPCPVSRDRSAPAVGQEACPTCRRPSSNRRRWRQCWDRVVSRGEGCRRSAPERGDGPDQGSSP
ncbi:DUF2256 domain-containing protein [Tautonia plasticadhaerens]|uniref:DUF2256 domain-containing protein n=1 Tax=Tautonia plasticadhaerens TaxID=2527974 RepID=UPI0018D24D5D